MHHRAVYSSLHRGRPMAATIAPSSSDRLAWVGVYPLDIGWQETQQLLNEHMIDHVPPFSRIYHIRIFEVLRQLIEDDVWISEENLENNKSLIVFSDADLEKALEKIGVPLNSLKAHYQCDYPI